jgi:hypothetical protein
VGAFESGKWHGAGKLQYDTKSLYGVWKQGKFMQAIRPKDSSSKQQPQVKSPGSKERNSRSPVNAEGSTNLFDIKEVVKTSRMKPSKHQTDVI